MKGLAYWVGGVALAAAGVGTGLAASVPIGAVAFRSVHLSAAVRAADTNCQAVTANLRNPNDPSSSFSVTGAYPSTAAKVASWEAQRDGTGSGLMSSAPGSELVTVCFITGQLAGSATGPAPTSRPDGPGNGSYRALVAIVLPDGSWVPDVLLHGLSVPYSAPSVTSQAPKIHTTVS